MQGKTKLSRRAFLRLSGGILAAAPFVRATAPAFAGEPDPIIEPVRRPFGRVISEGLSVREYPSINARRLRVLKLNEVIPLKGQTVSDESPTTYNKTWYQTDDGFAYSAYVQSAENTLNKPLDAVGEQGFWGEITVPLTEARGAPDAKALLRYRYYFGSTFKIIASVTDDEQAPWYQISDEYAGSGFYVKAEHIRPIPPEEFAPLSPEVPPEEKRIEVDLQQQQVTAYEADKPVFSARVATGASFRMADGSMQNFGTTPGLHRIFLKMPSQHMAGGTAGDSDYYDLPGIGWVSYFTASGIAFHSTYWHNDYGWPRSHGCVNMLPEDAKWVYLWTLPAAPYEARSTRTAGTLVKVIG